MNAKISIALASYNGERYIREQLDSILAQTVQDFELIVCDDCSTDSTVEILNKYAEKDGRIKIFENETNLGFKKNFEKAISLCSGEYIALSDQDDIWLPEHLEKLLSIIESNSLACGNALMVDGCGNSLGRNLNEVDSLFAFNSETVLYKQFFSSNPFQGASMLLRSDFVRSVLPVPEKIRFHDSWFAYCACMENGIAYTFDAINKYRQHGNNVTFSFHNKTNRNFICAIYSKIKILFSKVQTDRFYYSEALFNKYGANRTSFEEIYKAIQKLKERHFFLCNVVFFWKNYEKITTKKGHKGFLKRLLIWNKWQEIE